MSIPKFTSDNPLRQGVDGENRDFYAGANTSQAIAYNIREVKPLGKENGSAVSDSSLLERVAGGRRWILISRLTLEFAYGQIVLPNEYQKPLSCPQTTERNFMNLRLLPTLGAFGCASGGASVAVTGKDIATLTRRTAEANAALVHGDIDGYLALIEHAKDYTLMAPFGGATTRGFDTSSENRAAMARFFKSGTFDQEVVATYDSDGLVVLVTIERVRAEVGELSEQDWSLRVTQVFRRDGAEWRLVHRHADPLVNGISLEQAAALARGDQMR